MKPIFQLLCMLLLGITFQTQAQIINMNPDPNGEPWWSGGAEAAPAGSSGIEFTPSAASLATTLPSSVYNENQIWFPYIINQPGQSCVQTAEIWYTFAYEINRKRNVAASNQPYLTNLYYPLYTYNFLNDGSGSASTDFESGFNIIKQNGCPSWDVYDDPAIYNSSTTSVY